MREFVFRAKRISDGSWVEGGIMRTFHPNYDSNGDDFWARKPNCYCICANNKDYFVEQQSIGQFTGLCDKNGNRIFEGDIVKIDDEYIRYIEYSGECAAFVKFRYIDKLTSEFCGYLGKGYDNYKQTIEVIGNIHDTPELLKSEVAERREVSENNTVRCFHPSVTESQREAERREDIEKSPVDCSTPSVTDLKGDTE